MNENAEELEDHEARIRRIEQRLAAFAIGTKVNASALAGVLPISAGGTSSPTGPLNVIPRFVNNSGGALANGDVVVRDVSADRRIKASTQNADISVVGVVSGTGGPYANGSETPVMTVGYHASLAVQGAVAAGAYLAQSTTSKKAVSQGLRPTAGSFAVALTAFAGPGAGAVTAFVFPVDLQVGRAGPPGPPGQDGEDGRSMPGPRGAQGPAGAAGAAGARGRAGPPGMGQDGEPGIMRPGPRGPAGATGATGAAGARGRVGPPGTEGAAGEKGMPIPGRRGATGAAGAAGAAGARGATGARGQDGEAGEDGMSIPGRRGAPGPRGRAGPPGFAFGGADDGGAMFTNGPAAYGPPTALAGMTAINGSSSRGMRADAAPAINPAIAPTWTGVHTWSGTTAPQIVIAPATGNAILRLAGASGSVSEVSFRAGATSKWQLLRNTDDTFGLNDLATPTVNAILVRPGAVPGLHTVGYFRVGSATAPGASAAGDLFATRAFISGGAQAVPGAGSTGQRIQIDGTQGTVAAADFAIGVESGFMWFTHGSIAGGYNFYDNAGNLRTKILTGVSNIGLYSLGLLNVGSLATPANVTGGDLTAIRGFITSKLQVGGATVPVHTFEVSGSMDVRTGVFTTFINSQSTPSAPDGGGLAVIWNFSGGGGEVDFFNCYSTGGYYWYQRTGASTQTFLASLDAAGNFAAVGSITADHFVGGPGVSTFTHATGFYNIELVGTGTGAATYGFYIDTSSSLHLDAVSVAQIAIWAINGDYQILGNNAYKASGTAWINPSDARLKADIGPFPDGLELLRRLQPKQWTYNDLAGAAARGQQGIGFVAQDLEGLADYMVQVKAGKLGARQIEDLRHYDGHALPFVLVNAVKELDRENQGLRARLVELEQRWPT